MQTETDMISGHADDESPSTPHEAVQKALKYEMWRGNQDSKKLGAEYYQPTCDFEEQ